MRPFFTRSLEAKEILKEVFQIEGKKQKFGSVQTKGPKMMTMCVSFKDFFN